MRVLFLIFFLPFHLLFSQTDINRDYPQYDVILKHSDDFNNDKIKDVLYVLSRKEKTEENIVSKNKLVIYKGGSNKNFIKIYDNDDIFPCKECLGKSDNYAYDLSFKNNILSYTMSIAPFASDNYSIIKFTLEFSDRTFIIYGYDLQYFSIDKDISANIHLSKNDFLNKDFNYYNWELDSGWIDNLKINDKNLMKINNFAHQMKKIDTYLSVRLSKQLKTINNSKQTVKNGSIK